MLEKGDTSEVTIDLIHFSNPWVLTYHASWYRLCWFLWLPSGIPLIFFIINVPVIAQEHICKKKCENANENNPYSSTNSKKIALQQPSLTKDSVLRIYCKENKEMPQIYDKTNAV